MLLGLENVTLRATRRSVRCINSHVFVSAACAIQKREPQCGQPAWSFCRGQASKSENLPLLDSNFKSFVLDGKIGNCHL